MISVSQEHPSARRGAAPLLAGLPVLASLFAAACAQPVADRTISLSFPSFDELLGDAPADRDLPDDVKADGPLPARYLELAARQSPVRDQGQRGVCTIFASTALLEHTLVARDLPDVDYSEQFLQWTHKREGLAPSRSESSVLSEVMDTLAARGTVQEVLWPYQPERWEAPSHPECTGSSASTPFVCATNGEPSFAARTGTREKLAAGRYLRSSAIKAYLHTQHTPVVVGLDFIEEAWSYPPTVQRQRPGAWARGEVPFPSEKERADSALRGRQGHAVLIVGWDDDHAVPVIGDDGLPLLDAEGQPVEERGFYLFKNSWGTDYWGAENEVAAGYGWISQRYVAELGHTYAVGLPSGAPPALGGELHTGSSGLALPARGIFEDRIEVATGGPLSQARIELAIDHARAADLTVELLHDDLAYTIWRGGAGTTVRGAWNLNGALHRVDRGGSWSLRVTDSVEGTSGTLVSWSLLFQ